jgi:hypothetical protein
MAWLALTGAQAANPAVSPTAMPILTSPDTARQMNLFLFVNCVSEVFIRILSLFWLITWLSPPPASDDHFTFTRVARHLPFRREKRWEFRMGTIFLVNYPWYNGARPPVSIEGEETGWIAVSHN